MYKEIVKAMNEPDLKRIWAEQGADAGGMPPAEMEKLVKAEIAQDCKTLGSKRLIYLSDIDIRDGKAGSLQSFP